MIIDDLRSGSTETEAEISARVVWECVDRQPQRVYFRVPRRFEGLLWTGLEPFLCAAVVPAMAAGEARIHSLEPVCPVLVEGIETAVFWLRKWYPSLYPDAAPALSLPSLRSGVPDMPLATGLFLSGGVDSLYSLRRNASYIPAGHPARVRYAITVLGFDIGGKRHEIGSTDAQAAFDALLTHTSRISTAAGIENIPLATNLRHLDDRSGFWGQEFVGAALGAVANAVSSGVSRILVSSGGETIPSLGMKSPEGTHPLIDGCFGNSWLTVVHYAIQAESRLARLATIADDSILLNGIRVCYSSPPDKLNCGRCEKCVRTMLQLEALGKLRNCGAFDTALCPKLIDHVDISADAAETMFRELLEVFAQQGRSEYLRPISNMLHRYAAYKAWRDETDFKGLIKRFDRRYFNGVLTRVAVRSR